MTADPTMRRLAVASLVAQVAIVVTGGAVRLTGSGLGCPTWPRCVDSSFTPTSEYGIHGAIEFGNRLLTFALVLVAAATLLAAWRLRPRREDVRRLALLLFLGIPAQGVLGGITVLTGLNPWTVGGHFLLSMVLIALATFLVARTGHPQGVRRLSVPAPLRGLALAQLAVVAVVLVLGTVVTGSGPHAGDIDVPRNGIDPESISQLHADGVFLLVGLTVAYLVALHAVGAPAAARRAAAVLLVVELAQGVVGFVQYATDLPVLLVALHMLGASVLVVAAVRSLDTLRVPLSAGRPDRDPGIDERPVAAQPAARGRRSAATG